jgi:hypothetical protein
MYAENRIQCAAGNVNELVLLSALNHPGMGMLLGNKCNTVHKRNLTTKVHMDTSMERDVLSL